MQQAITIRIDLHEATPLELLLHALALEGEGAPGVRIVASVRQEVDLLAELAVRSQVGVELELGELGATLEGIGRRLDVALELMRRDRRPAEAKA